MSDASPLRTDVLPDALLALPGSRRNKARFLPKKTRFLPNKASSLLVRARTIAAAAMTAALFCCAAGAATAAPPERPNIVVILADDLGYGDLGCYGQRLIRTPRLDQMAAEGMKFRNFYAGATVCAPSRCVLMTGLHHGHAHVRGNAGGDMSVQSLRAEDVTMAEVLQQAGYRTALCGKWGLGDDLDGARDGLPRRQGFDLFFGYLNQVHAHNYYPEFLWRNETREPLRNEVHKLTGNYGGFAGGWATKRVDYSHDLIVDAALQFVREQQARPFFLYLAATIPHANNEATRGLGDGQEVPDYAPYDAEDWPAQDKGQAAMITRLDRDVGRLLDLLQELRIAERTVVLFASDNGPHQEGGHHPERFLPQGPLRGFKRDLYEGGIRSPLIVWWPGTTPSGAVSDHVSYAGDLFATAAELAGVAAPEGLDSISIVPEITGRPADQRRHEQLYFEFYERGGAQAVRQGDWKAVRAPMHTGPIELYNLADDLGEARDVAAEHPEIVKDLQARMEAAHRPHPNWKPGGAAPRMKSPPGDGRARF